MAKKKDDKKPLDEKKKKVEDKRTETRGDPIVKIFD